jgi:hypothetical protein
LLLVGWIVVEGAVIREFSVLQPVCALAGAALAGAGDRTLLRRLSRRPEGSPQR